MRRTKPAFVAAEEPRIHAVDAIKRAGQ